MLFRVTKRPRYPTTAQCGQKVTRSDRSTETPGETEGSPPVAGIPAHRAASLGHPPLILNQWAKLWRKRSRGGIRDNMPPANSQQGKHAGNLPEKRGLGSSQESRGDKGGYEIRKTEEFRSGWVSPEAPSNARVPGQCRRAAGPNLTVTPGDVIF